MIEGRINLHWRDGSTYQIPLLFSHIKGIQRENQRPSSYTVSLSSGSLTELEAIRLNEWLRIIPAILERIQSPNEEKDKK
jgi:hypothetical protein